MKKIITLLCISFFVIFVFGCNYTNVTNSNKDASKEMKVLNANIESNENNLPNDSYDVLLNKIKKMNGRQFSDFVVNYHFIVFNDYIFILLDEEKFVFLEITEGEFKIIDGKIMNTITPTQNEINQIKTGQTVEEVLSIMGYPSTVITKMNILGYTLVSNGYYKISFDENMIVTKIVKFEYDYTTDPTVVIDEYCKEVSTKTNIENANLICENMTFREVTEILGAPQRASGSGVIQYQWDLGDDILFLINFISTKKFLTRDDLLDGLCVARCFYR